MVQKIENRKLVLKDDAGWKRVCATFIAAGRSEPYWGRAPQNFRPDSPKIFNLPLFSIFLFLFGGPTRRFALVESTRNLIGKSIGRGEKSTAPIG